ncbi:MAG: type II toxin-antitoxin system VapC family toxin [Actinomycetota bacterium]|nr:type II toxin-antitoxin system VapC family toxin [Actinomycetota bacterium]
MIVVDTSALVSVVLGEDDAELMLAALEGAQGRLSAVSWVEAQIVVEARQGPDAARDLQLLVESTIVDIVGVDDVHATAAVTAWRRFGKGRHPAALNFGDCFAYALARLDGLPLLFKGGDFSQTDVESLL